MVNELCKYPIREELEQMKTDMGFFPKASRVGALEQKMTELTGIVGLKADEADMWDRDTVKNKLRYLEE
jgi:hypothetical protein